MGNQFDKDPDAILDYKWNWSSWLEAGETLSTYAITVSAGLTNPESTFNSSAVTAWITGGTVGTVETAACLIETNSSRTDERTIYLDIKHR